MARSTSMTDLSSLLRKKAINSARKLLLISNYRGTNQEKDLSESANCNGFGRIRHFKLYTGEDWIQDPLPILPAASSLGIIPSAEMRAQVFQNAVCNWRCWYCFVDPSLLNGDSKFASFMTCDEMLDLYLQEENPANIIDLSGGHPDLTPEWIPWMMEALKSRGLEEKVFLWSDDNLSVDYLWKYLSDDQIVMMSSYPKYSRVCCFKGIDEKSFSLNTKADPKYFSNQFDLFKRLLGIKIDLYGYITLTAASDTNFKLIIPNFFDRIQEIAELFPLRIVPLKILEFSPVSSRMNREYVDMMKGQYIAIQIWKDELRKRFTQEQLSLPITEVKIK